MRKEVYLVLFIIIFLSTGAHAQITNFADMDSDFQEKTGLDLNEDISDELLLVIGGRLNVIEEATLRALRTSLASIRDAERIPDETSSLARLDETEKVIIFFGGPTQNDLAALYAETLESADFRDYGVFVTLYGESNGRQVVIFSDSRGFNNYARMSARVSPLKSFIPERYVPIAAAGISVLLLVLLDFLATLFENYIQMLGTRRKHIKEEYAGISIYGLIIRWREVLSITVAAVIFGAALAWMWTAGGDNFGEVFLLSVLVSIVVFVIQEGLRMFFAWRRGVTSEFVIYPLGIFIAVVSTLLGNLLAGPGTCLFGENDEPGPIYYGVMLTVFIFSTIFFVLNVLYPSQLMQVIMTVTSTVSFFEFFPIEPINGKAVYTWNKKVWWVTMIVLTPIYILINFFL